MNDNKKIESVSKEGGGCKKLGYLSAYDRNTNTQLFITIKEGERAQRVIDSPELLMHVTRVKGGSHVESFWLKVRGDFASLEKSRVVGLVGKKDITFPMSVNEHSFGLRCFPDPKCPDNILFGTTSGLSGVGIRSECNPWPIVVLVGIGVAGIVAIVAIDKGASLKIDVNVAGNTVSVEVGGGGDSGGGDDNDGDDGDGDDGGGDDGGDSGGGDGGGDK